jgi:hypothetical protein
VTVVWGRGELPRQAQGAANPSHGHGCQGAGRGQMPPMDDARAQLPAPPMWRLRKYAATYEGRPAAGKEHQEKIAAVEAELARRQSARSDEGPGTWAPHQMVRRSDVYSKSRDW